MSRCLKLILNCTLQSKGLAFDMTAKESEAQRERARAGGRIRVCLLSILDSVSLVPEDALGPLPFITSE